VADDCGVEVEPAHVVQPGGGDHLEVGHRGAYDADVEGTGAEVVHDQAAIVGDPPAQDGGEVDGGGDRLRHETDFTEPSVGGGLSQHTKPGTAPRRGVGEHHLSWRHAGHAARLTGTW
jgi:hypothetical protein